MPEESAGAWMDWKFEARKSWETAASLAVGVTTQDSGVLGHPPAVGILRSYRFIRPTDRPLSYALRRGGVEPKYHRARAAGTATLNIYTARTAALASLINGRSKERPHPSGDAARLK